MPLNFIADVCRIVSPRSIGTFRWFPVNTSLLHKLHFLLYFSTTLIHARYCLETLRFQINKVSSIMAFVEWSSIHVQSHEWSFLLLSKININSYSDYKNVTYRNSVMSAWLPRWLYHHLNSRLTHQGSSIMDSQLYCVVFSAHHPLVVGHICRGYGAVNGPSHR